MACSYALCAVRFRTHTGDCMKNNNDKYARYRCIFCNRRIPDSVYKLVVCAKTRLGIVRDKQETDRNNLYKNNGLYEIHKQCLHAAYLGKRERQ